MSEPLKECALIYLGSDDIHSHRGLLDPEMRPLSKIQLYALKAVSLILAVMEVGLSLSAL